MENIGQAPRNVQLNTGFPADVRLRKPGGPGPRLGDGDCLFSAA